jgi:hypothetical protein
MTTGKLNNVAEPGHTPGCAVRLRPLRGYGAASSRLRPLRQLRRDFDSIIDDNQYSATVVLPTMSRAEALPHTRRVNGNYGQAARLISTS